MFKLIKFCIFSPFYIVYYAFKIFYKIISFFFNLPLETNLKTIDSMDGIQFENYIAKLLKYSQFSNIKTTKASGDYGADIIAEKNKVKYAIQCKRYSNKVGVTPIGEVLRGMKKYNCSRGIVITNNFFTKQAIEEAKICNIELWDRNTIKNIIHKYNVNTENSIEEIEVKKTKNKSDTNIKLEKLDYNDYKETSKRIQHIFYDLGFNVKVVDLDNTHKYVTKYKCIHELEDYPLILESNTYEKFLQILNIENSTIKDIDNKYFIINIPLQMINN